MSTYKHHEKQLNLGELLLLLKRCASQEAELRYDFCYTEPTRLNSYRGDYSDLALGWQDYGRQSPSSRPKVKELVVALEQAKSIDFHGWKGGTYRMEEGTILWVANPGDWTQTMIVGVIDDSYEEAASDGSHGVVILETAYDK